MNYFEKIIGDIETHTVDGIIECFMNGVNPNAKFRDEPLIYELTSEYGRGPGFKKCVKAFVDHGLEFNDKALLSVLLDDASSLKSVLKKDGTAVHKVYSLRCAFTPLEKITLLHICAEFNHVACARLLVEYGADVDFRAGIDEFGFGGHTPIFHTVNQNRNQSAEMLEYLLSLSANLEINVKGLIWGKGYPWETLVPAVNPISYAMMGLLPQMHRDERVISKTVSLLIRAAYGIAYISKNIPNAYLKS